MRNFLSVEERLAHLEKHEAYAPDREEMDRVTGQVKQILDLLAVQRVIKPEDYHRIAGYDPSPGSIPKPEPVESMEAGESLKPTSK